MRKVLRFLFVIVLSVWAVDLSAQSQAVQFFAHRASRFEYDENTLPAFKACYEQGIRGFETDIRMSKDGQLVVNHDETFARLTPCTGAVGVICLLMIAAFRHIFSANGKYTDGLFCI